MPTPTPTSSLTTRPHPGPTFSASQAAFNSSYIAFSQSLSTIRASSFRCHASLASFHAARISFLVSFAFTLLLCSSSKFCHASKNSSAVRTRAKPSGSVPVTFFCLASWVCKAVLALPQYTSLRRLPACRGNVSVQK
jgi:hypothetical protein